MTVKDKVLDLLDRHKGSYFSGEQIAKNLNVSRAAVWKAINNLRSDGYAIDAVTNKGYSLSAHTDILSQQGISKYLIGDSRTLSIEILNTVDSTNTYLRQKANQGAAEGCTVIAGSQSAGRGRSGRSFYSPDGSGIYLSTLLRPRQCSASQALRITTMAAVAMCDAITKVSNQKPVIKWVNDIYLDDKKICGILTEGSFSLETGLLEYAILGLGLNLYQPATGFPAELSSIAGSLFSSQQDDLKNRLTAQFLNDFTAYYKGNAHQQIVDKYRDYSMVIGKEIVVIKDTEEIPAIAQDIDEECHLIVKFPNGHIEKLSYGEIRIRMP